MTVAITRPSRKRGGTLAYFIKSKTAVSTFALVTAIGAVQPAWATIDNTVTASGTAPGGVAGAVTATADETVDVEDAAPDLLVTKTASFAGSDVGVNDTVTYTYTVANTGNVTISNVSLSDAHDGAGSGVTPSSPSLTTGSVANSPDDGLDNTYDTLAPGDIVTWTASYTVVQGDLNNNGGGDGDIDNTVTATATPVTGTFAGGPFTATESVPLEAQNASLLVTKVASDDTDVEVGDTITYTYTVTNNGNVPISNISLADDVTAGTGGDPTPIITDGSLIDNGTASDSSDDALDEIYDTLGVNDVITYTGTYVVTQSDVDNLQ